MRHLGFAIARSFLVGGASLASGTVFVPGALADPYVAYAHVLGDGKLDAANSREVLAMAGGNGLYCFKLAFIPKNAVATLADDPTAPNQGIGYIKVAVPPTQAFGCSGMSDPDAYVVTGTATSVNGGQSAGGYPFYVYWTR
jgi:hypothetical protein